MQTQFTKEVIQIITRIPKGKVATYGQIAKMALNPRGARAVSYILHSSAKKYNLPWHRVINSKGKISFNKNTKNYKYQKKLLITEGIVFESDDSINLNKFLFTD